MWKFISFTTLNWLVRCWNALNSIEIDTEAAQFNAVSMSLSEQFLGL